MEKKITVLPAQTKKTPNKKLIAVQIPNKRIADLLALNRNVTILPLQNTINLTGTNKRIIDLPVNGDPAESFLMFVGDPNDGKLFQTRQDQLKFVRQAMVGQEGGVPGPLTDGKIPPAQLPAIAITDTFVVASQAEMLALDVQVGDVAVRTDNSTTYILKAAPASVLANWVPLASPAPPDTNFANTNLQLSADRFHALNGYIMTINRPDGTGLQLYTGSSQLNGNLVSINSNTNLNLGAGQNLNLGGAQTTLSGLINDSANPTYYILTVEPGTNRLYVSARPVDLPIASAINTGKLLNTDWTIFNSKQAALVSGTTIKTVKSASLVGAGNIAISGSPMRASWDGAGTSITPGNTVFIVVDYLASLIGWSIAAVPLAIGSPTTCTIDVWRIAAGTALPTVANSIMGTKPALVTGNVIRSTAMAGWTVATFAIGDIIGINIDACSNISKLFFKLETLEL